MPGVEYHILIWATVNGEFFGSIDDQEPKLYLLVNTQTLMAIYHCVRLCVEFH